MRLTETVIEVGEGTHLDTVYRIETAHLQKVRAYRYQNQETIEEWFELRYKTFKSDKFEYNHFSTASALELQLKRWFTDLTLHATPTSRHHQERIPPLSALIGQPFISFTLNLDESLPFQCKFGKAPYDIHTWESIVLPSVSTANDVGFANALYELLGQVVTYVDEYVDAGIVFDFENGSSLEFNLNTPKYGLISYKGPDNTGATWYTPPETEYW